ncbi:MAG: hypothetical protein SGI87_07330 [Flavobacteriales bacterium]|nr:hypothetical protein [Flavobacteriales bacterium]
MKNLIPNMHSWTRLALICFFALAISCKKDSQSESYIYGKVRDYYTHEPVPFARVGVIMHKNTDIFTTTETVVDTLIAFGDGGFRLDRSKYEDLQRVHNATGFYVCADGPIVGGEDFYDDNCSTGAFFIPNQQTPILCDITPLAWVRIFVNDEDLPNPEVYKINFFTPWSWQGAIGTFPENYDPDNGYVAQVAPMQEVELTVNLFYWDEEGNSHLLDSSLVFQSTGLDTVDVWFDY